MPDDDDENKYKLISHTQEKNVNRWLSINKKLITKAWKIRNIFFGNKDVKSLFLATLSLNILVLTVIWTFKKIYEFRWSWIRFELQFK